MLAFKDVRTTPRGRFLIPLGHADERVIASGVQTSRFVGTCWAVDAHSARHCSLYRYVPCCTTSARASAFASWSARAREIDFKRLFADSRPALVLFPPGLHTFGAGCVRAL